MNGFDSSGYETKQVFYSSKDGTKVPMFVVHRKVSAPAVQSFKACSAATHGAVTVDTDTQSAAVLVFVVACIFTET